MREIVREGYGQEACAIAVACVTREGKNSEQGKNTKVNGQEERGKNDKSGTKEGLEKNQNVGHNGAREDRSLTPTKKALRATL